MSRPQDASKGPGCMFAGFICCWSGCDFENFVCCYLAESDCLCIREGCCCAFGKKTRGCGLVTDASRPEEICKLGCICCDCGLIKPQTLCSGAGQMCCFSNAQAFPFQDDVLDECVCAYYGLQCNPECGCCLPPPKSPMLMRLLEKPVMER